MASPRLLWADTFEGSGGQVELGPSITSYGSSTLVLASMWPCTKCKRGFLYVKDCAFDAAICDMIWDMAPPGAQCGEVGALLYVYHVYRCIPGLAPPFTVRSYSFLNRSYGDYAPPDSGFMTGFECGHECTSVTSAGSDLY